MSFHILTAVTTVFHIDHLVGHEYDTTTPLLRLETVQITAIQIKLLRHQKCT